MTGYGTAQGRLEGWDVSIAIKAVNHRGLDVRVHIGRDFGWLEPKIQEHIKGVLYRGRVDVNVELSAADTGEVDLHIDERAFGEVCKVLDELAERHGLARPLRMEEVLGFKRSFERADALAARPVDTEGVLALVASATDAFVESREREGRTIHAELSARRERLLDDVDRVRLMRPRLLDSYRDRLRERLEELASRDGIEVDDDRVASELVVFAERTDIAEEVQRAGAHLESLGELFDQGMDAAIGKKIDFYLQELIRETNTMASKSNFADLTSVVVDMKAAIEQMREQTANVE